jgi:hypothetical protein
LDGCAGAGVAGAGVAGLGVLALFALFALFEFRPHERSHEASASSAMVISDKKISLLI